MPIAPPQWATELGIIGINIFLTELTSIGALGALLLSSQKKNTFPDVHILMKIGFVLLSKTWDQIQASDLAAGLCFLASLLSSYKWNL